ncbi:MAG: glycosyl hydrolase, partial [Myxococcota bacterium]
FVPSAEEDDGSCIYDPSSDAELVWQLGAPIGTAPPALATITHPSTPISAWSSISGPLPTNAWFMNTGLGDGNLVINTLPYLVRSLGNRLMVGLPTTIGISSTFVFTAAVDDLSLGATEAIASREIVDFDLLSVTLEWAGASSGSMRAPLVRGSPYITMFYDGLTPRLSSERAIVALNGSGTRYEVSLNTGEAFVIYASSSVDLAQSGGGIEASAPFTGTLRVARLSAAEAVLDAHADAIPTGGTLSADIENSEGNVTFDWERTGSGSLLMMALPHHQAILTGATTTAYTQKTIRGTMVGITGDQWVMDFDLPPLGFQAERPINSSFTSALESALALEKGALPTSTDTYFFGTEIGRMARLLLIAEALGDEESAAQLTTALKGQLAPWIAGTNADPLVYDTVWGGVVPQAAAANPSAQFGSGWYNDHHFHYGYHVY